MQFLLLLPHLNNKYHSHPLIGSVPNTILEENSNFLIINRKKDQIINFAKFSIINKSSQTL